MREIVIKISEEDYDKIQSGLTCYYPLKKDDMVVLPKGHGDLIDRLELCGKVHGLKSVCALSDAKAIVKADRSEE